MCGWWGSDSKERWRGNFRGWISKEDQLGFDEFEGITDGNSGHVTGKNSPRYAY